MSRISIRSIKVCNFKAFESIDVSLGKFNVLIGANASGKSNFVSVFRFLKDIFDNGLRNAISMQGGVDCLRNASIRASKDMVIDIQFEIEKTKEGFPVPIKTKVRKKTRFGELILTSLSYKFSLQFFKKRRGYQVKEETLEGSFELKYGDKKNGNESRQSKEIAEGTISIKRDKCGVACTLNPKSLPIELEGIFPFYSLRKSTSSRRMQMREGSNRELAIIRGESMSLISLFENRLFSPFTSAVAGFIGRMSTFDIDPKLSKRSTLITGRTELESDGSNIAIVLQDILGSKKSREKLHNILRDILPFVDTLWVENLSDKSVLTCLKESYCTKKFMPAPLISDGTMNLLALIIALHFSGRNLIVIEEPERSIHPHLISRVVSMMKDVSERMGKQIIVTTHNPELVKHVGIDNILLSYRDKNGFSQISRPSEKSEVKEFLVNKLGVEELFVQNLLQW